MSDHLLYLEQERKELAPDPEKPMLMDASLCSSSCCQAKDLQPTAWQAEGTEMPLSSSTVWLPSSTQPKVHRGTCRDCSIEQGQPHKTREIVEEDGGCWSSWERDRLRVNGPGLGGEPVPSSLPPPQTSFAPSDLPVSSLQPPICRKDTSCLRCLPASKLALAQSTQPQTEVACAPASVS